MSHTTRLVPLVIAALGAASLVARGVDAAPGEGGAPSRRVRAHPTRPIVADRREIAYADLPLLEPVPYAKCSEAVIRVSLERFLGNPYATALRPPQRWQIFGLPADSNLRIGSGHHVSEMPGPPSTDPTLSAAEWVTLERAKTTADRAAISRCVGRATAEISFGADAAATGHANAIVPGRVYAYRRCVAGCDGPLDGSARVEELGVLSSPALWVSSSGWGSNGCRDEDSFGRGVATVQRGTTATIVIGVPPYDASLGVLRSPKGTTDADTFDIEVVWPEDGEATMSVFSGHAEGVAVDLAAR